MNRRRYLVSCGALLSSGLAGCTEETSYEPGNDGSDGPTEPSDGGGDPIPTPEETPEDSPPEGSLTILEHELVRIEAGTEWETVDVAGRARNDSDRQFGYAEIRVRFYNSDGELLDSMIDNVNDIDSGQVWQFSVPFLGWGEEARAVDGYDIAVGTVF